METENENVFFGNRHEWGQEHPFGLGISERRQHVYVIGQTGTGKSTLLRNLILQDIELGRGVGLIDPHGDLAHDIIDHIPPWRTDDVAYFDPRPMTLLPSIFFEPRVTTGTWLLLELFLHLKRFGATPGDRDLNTFYTPPWQLSSTAIIAAFSGFPECSMMKGIEHGWFGK